MKLTLLTIFILTFSINSNASNKCTISTSEKILIIKQNNNLSKYLQNTNCSKSTISKFVKIISKANGLISSKVVRKQLSIDNIEVNITPNRFKVYNLDQILRKSFSDDSIVLKNIKISSSFQKLNFNQETSFQVECNFCENLGQKNFKIVINNPIENQKTQLWGYLDLYVQKLAYVAKKDLSFNQDSLSKSYFEKKSVLTQTPENLVINIGNIKFYKLNKNIRKGTSLLKRDLFEQNIIRAFSPVKVIIKSGEINLQTMAQALESGTIGQFIKLRNTRNKKILMGKVIDNNLVEIKL